MATAGTAICESRPHSAAWPNFPRGVRHNTKIAIARWSGRTIGAPPHHCLEARMAAACLRAERTTPVLLQLSGRGAAEFCLGGVTIAQFDPPGGSKSVRVELRQGDNLVLVPPGAVGNCHGSQIAGGGDGNRAGPCRRVAGLARLAAAKTAAGPARGPVTRRLRGMAKNIGRSISGHTVGPQLESRIWEMVGTKRRAARPGPRRLGVGREVRRPAAHRVRRHEPRTHGTIVFLASATRPT